MRPRQPDRALARHLRPRPRPSRCPGSVYLDRPLLGRPFGISVVTPAIAGPFNLGDVTVRSKILVDPNTAAVTIESDPFPTFVKGVPAQIKAHQRLSRPPELPVQPDELRPEADHRHAHRRRRSQPERLSSPFQVQSCPSLPFHPTLTASTKGNASKANGASLHWFKVTSTQARRTSPKHADDPDRPAGAPDDDPESLH